MVAGFLIFTGPSFAEEPNGIRVTPLYLQLRPSFADHSKSNAGLISVFSGLLFVDMGTAQGCVEELQSLARKQGLVRSPSYSLGGFAK